MILNSLPRKRRGAVIVESAVIYPVTFLLILGLMIGGMGVFRYQQVASLAREGARWASVRGDQYAKDTGNSASSAADVYNNAILPNASGLNVSKLGYNVSWSASATPQTVIADNGAPQTTTVSVTVTYQWVPEAFLGGIQLQSTSVMPMTN